MRIDRIHIMRFGGIADLDLELSPGVNVIYGPNESGKSTVMRFVCFVLYGFADKTERENNMPPGFDSVSGWMVVTDGHGGKEREFRLERECFRSGLDRLSVINTATGAVVSRDKAPGISLLGLPREMFVKTAYISQSDGLSFDGSKLNDSIENILFSGDETVNTSSALKKLDSARVELSHKSGGGGKIGELRDKLITETAALETAEKNHAAVLERQIRLEDMRARLDTCEKNEAKLREGADAIGDLKTLRYAEQVEEYGRFLATKKKELSQYRAEGTWKGFLPNRLYLEKLKELKNDRDRLVAEKVTPIDTRTVPVDETAKKRLRESGRRISEAGGRQKVLDGLTELDAKVRRAQTFALLMGLLFLFAAAATVADALLAPRYILPFIVADVLFLAAMLVCFYFRAKYLSDIDKYLAEWSAEDYNTLSVALDSVIEETEIVGRDESIADENRKKFEEAIARLKEKDTEISKWLSMWGRADLDATIEEVEELRTGIENREKEIEGYQAKYDAMASSGYVESSSIRAKLEAAGVDPDNADPDDLSRRLDFARKAADSQRNHVHSLETELAALTAVFAEPAPIAERCIALMGEIEKLEARRDALALAYETLESASDALRASVAPALTETAGKLMAAATDGSLRTLGVSGELSLNYERDGRTMPEELMSSGTKDAAYICLRLSLLQLLAAKADPPIMTDEAFSRLDDKRLSRMIRLFYSLGEAGIQSLIFTAQKREGEVLSELDPEAMIIEL
ncbi:MAG: ATP-binding protein [Eubacteriales bacterium]|jgi:uncharacterized protein YhaN